MLTLKDFDYELPKGLIEIMFLEDDSEFSGEKKV